MQFLTAVTLWLKDRLKLEVSPEKTKIVNARKRYTEFLGFKTRLSSKGNGRYKIASHMGDKALKNAREKLTKQAHKIAKPPDKSTEAYEAMLYNSMVMGIQNYYSPATTMSNVTIIPAKKNNSTENTSGCLTKVAAYCRVSTAEENQQNSYATQIAYYTEYITSNPDWQLVGIFADEGISGTQTTNRTQFNKMMKLARRKKIDIFTAY